MNSTQQYAVKNLRTQKLSKDAITSQTVKYETRESAEKAAFSLNRFAAIDRKDNRHYVVVVL